MARKKSTKNHSAKKTTARAAAQPVGHADRPTKSSTSARPAESVKASVQPAPKPLAQTKPHKQHLVRLTHIMPWMLAVVGVIGIICSIVLVYDQVKIWENPGYTPSCNLNPIVSCGSVIASKQGEVFGIPAVFLGLLSFPVFTTVGVAMLAGARFKRWFWHGMQLLATGGIVFAFWLFWLSMYRIHALCPFCLTVDVSMYTLFWYLTAYNFIEGNLPIHPKLLGLGRFVKRHHLDILLFGFVLIATWILQHFWYYFGKHL